MLTVNRKEVSAIICSNPAQAVKVLNAEPDCAVIRVNA